MNDDDIPCPYCGATVPQVDGALPAHCASCERELTIDGRYTLLSALGVGAVSVVYEARCASDRREVALKVLRREYAEQAEVRDAFDRSAALVRSLEHAQVPRIYDYFCLSDGQQVLVLEALEGKTLYDRVAIEGRQMPPERVEKFLVSMLEVLAYLQLREPPLIHGHIQPANIMFRTVDDWIPILVDFDAVTASAEVAKRADHPYLAPEALRGEAVGCSSDLYSLAMTILYLVSHQEPSQWPRVGESIDARAMLTGVDEIVITTLTRMLAPDPARRYVDARDAIGALVRRKLAREGRGRRVVAALVAALVVMCGAMLYLNREQLAREWAGTQLGVSEVSAASAARPAP